MFEEPIPVFYRRSGSPTSRSALGLCVVALLTTSCAHTIGWSETATPPVALVGAVRFDPTLEKVLVVEAQSEDPSRWVLDASRVREGTQTVRQDVIATRIYLEWSAGVDIFGRAFVGLFVLPFTPIIYVVNLFDSEGGEFSHDHFNDGEAGWFDDTWDFVNGFNFFEAWGPFKASRRATEKLPAERSYSEKEHTARGPAVFTAIMVEARCDVGSAELVEVTDEQGRVAIELAPLLLPFVGRGVDLTSRSRAGGPGAENDESWRSTFEEPGARHTLDPLEVAEIVRGRYGDEMLMRVPVDRREELAQAYSERGVVSWNQGRLLDGVCDLERAGLVRGGERVDWSVLATDGQDSITPFRTYEDWLAAGGKPGSGTGSARVVAGLTRLTGLWESEAPDVRRTVAQILAQDPVRAALDASVPVTQTIPLSGDAPSDATVLRATRIIERAGIELDGFRIQEWVEDHVD